MTLAERGFTVTYASELMPPRYIVERGAMRIVPSSTRSDPQSIERADALCTVLNRIYASRGGER